MRISDWSSDVCSSDLSNNLAQSLTQVLRHQAGHYVGGSTGRERHDQPHWAFGICSVGGGQLYHTHHTHRSEHGFKHFFHVSILLLYYLPLNTGCLLSLKALIASCWYLV